jgi:polysaccharide export outer membrane protein
VDELTGQQRVRPDGRVSLGVFGEVKVTGLTPLEISDKLEKFLDRYYRDVEVAVNVIGFYSKEIYVFGQVNTSAYQGTVSYTGQETVLEVIARMGGLSEIAAARYVKLIRPNIFKGNQPEEYRVNMHDIVLEGDYATNVMVRPYDSIYVPPTPTGAVAIFIRRMISPGAAAVRAAHQSRTYDAMVDGDFYDRGRGW